jgi:Carboxypeptidase regulatory-like domain/Carbohydrate-selective porin, OprB family
MRRFLSVVGGGIRWGLLLVLFGGGAPANAQEKPAQMPQMNMDHRGALQGRVRDGNGGAVADATVQAVSQENGAMFTATTDAQGSYAFGALPVAKYEISISRDGQTLFRKRDIDVAMDKTAQLDIALDAAAAAQAADFERQDLLAKIATLEQRITALESTTVLSEPETRTRRVQVFVDANGNEHDEQVPGSTPKITYRRERTYRRQTISEKIDAALEDAAKHSVTVGVDAAMATQFAARSRGDIDPSSGAYALASADLFFTAGIAQNTLFFADIVGLSGAPPDSEIPTLTLVNGYTARLVEQNSLNLREAWLRTEIFKNRLAIIAGRLDLTNYFDANAFANDESTQFLSDALVNNQMLGLAVNGVGAAMEYDPKHGFMAKFGFQQSSPEPTSLGDALFTLSEVGYTFTPFKLPEGTYRFWFRTDNTDPIAIRKGLGLSVDQKLSPVVGLFGRYGQQQTEFGDDHFYSAGVSLAKGLVLNPEDRWGVGYAQMDLASGDKEKLIEGYYNLLLTEKLRLSFHLSSVLDTPAGSERFSYLFPGIRFQAAF